MRVSVEPNDRGFTPLAGICRVLYEGRLMGGVLTADEDPPYIKHVVYKDGTPVVDSHGDWETAEITEGNVVILLAPHQQMALTPNFFRTAHWLQRCGKQPRNLEQASVQVGVHIEEMAEFVEQLELTGDEEQLAKTATNALHDLGALFKKAGLQVKFKDRVAALDALCDVEVTANGVAFLMGWDKYTADLRVLRANDDKMNPDGTPVILPGGKIGNREGWQPADLSDLVGPSEVELQRTLETVISNIVDNKYPRPDAANGTAPYAVPETVNLMDEVARQTAAKMAEEAEEKTAEIIDFSRKVGAPPELGMDYGSGPDSSGTDTPSSSE